MLIKDEKHNNKVAAELRERALDAAAPLIAETGSAAETEEVIAALPLPIDMSKIENYFSPIGYLPNGNHVLRVLVDWYITAHTLWQEQVVHGIVEESQPPLYIDFKASYLGWCRAHNISPEQGAAWESIYTSLRVRGFRQPPTLEFFLKMSGNAHCIVNGR